MAVTDHKTQAPMLDPAPRQRAGRASRAADFVVSSLAALCESLGPNGRIPTHTELMRRFGASERAVREALDTLQRSGRIVRRNGVGTFVAEPGEHLPPATAAVGRTIVAITRPDRSFFDRCMDLLFRHAEDADVNLVCQPVSTTDSVLVLPVSADGAGPLGILVFGYFLAPLAERLQEQGHRVVVVGTPPVDVTPAVPCVYHDHNQGGYLVTRHLLSLGHRRIAYVHAGAGELRRQIRWGGHQRALREARREGLTVEDSILPEEETDTWQADPARAAAFFARSDAPTGLVAWNDHEAARILQALIRAGIRVPEQVSLAGYDALPEGELVYPRLTTVDHTIGEQLRAAVDLLARPTPPPSTHTVVFVSHLLPRESTAAAPSPRTPGQP